MTKYGKNSKTVTVISGYAMFLPPSMLDIFTNIYKVILINQNISPNEKLGYKNHHSITKHQDKYEETTNSVINFLAPNLESEIKIYFSNVQRFICSLNQAAFETRYNKEYCLDVYWEYIYAPIISNFLENFSKKDDKDSVLKSLYNILLVWEPKSNPKESADWSKNTIKKIIEECLDFQPKDFINELNNIRSNCVETYTTMENKLIVLKNEITHLPNKDIIYNKIKSYYSATLIIRKFESKYNHNILKHISTNFKKNKYQETHKIIFQLLANDNLKINSWSEHPLILNLDEIIKEKIKPFLPTFLDYFPKNTYVFFPKKHEIGVMLDKLYTKNPYINYFIQPNNIDSAFLNYYKMIITTENNNYEMALDFCNNVEKLSNSVHLGEILSNTIKHKIFLNFLIKKTMKHNQFQLDISRLIMNLPDEYELTLNYSEKFNEFIASLDSNEIMILRVFRDLNYHYRINNDILYKLSEFIEEIIKIHKTNTNLKLDEILIQLKDSSLSYTLPFSNKLTLNKSLEFSHELYNYLGIDNNKNINYIKNVI